MQMRKYVYGATFAALAVVALAGKAQQPMQPSGAAQAVMANTDRDFFESAASANLFEIEAAKLAKQRATDPALREYAERMERDHSRAQDELAQLASKKGVTLPTELLRRHQMMLADLRNEKDGAGFDDEYRDKMVLDHKASVSLFDQAAKKSADPEVKAFAARMLPHLQAHGGSAKALPKP